MKVKTIHALAVIIIVMVSGCTSEKMVSKVVGRQLKVNVSPDYIYDKESIVVVTVGTGTPLPGERAQTGTAIFVNGYFFMFDVLDRKHILRRFCNHVSHFNWQNSILRYPYQIQDDNTWVCEAQC